MSLENDTSLIKPLTSLSLEALQLPVSGGSMVSSLPLSSADLLHVTLLFSLFLLWNRNTIVLFSRTVQLLLPFILKICSESTFIHPNPSSFSVGKKKVFHITGASLH